MEFIAGAMPPARETRRGAAPDFAFYHISSPPAGSERAYASAERGVSHYRSGQHSEEGFSGRGGLPAADMASACLRRPITHLSGITRHFHGKRHLHSY
jgi:hypothetical protein